MIYVSETNLQQSSKIFQVFFRFVTANLPCMRSTAGSGGGTTASSGYPQEALLATFESLC